MCGKAGCATFQQWHFGLIHSCGSSLGKGDPREGGANRRKASQCRSPLWLYGDFVALLPLQQGQVFSPAPPPVEIRDEVTMLTLNHEKTSKWGGGEKCHRDCQGPVWARPVRLPNDCRDGL